jgi:heme-binding NEAT domain protein
MSTTPVLSSNKYLVKSIEEEISLFDRKLAHLHNFETFENEEARLVAAGKLSTKRERLIRTLRELLDPSPTPEASSPSTKKTTKKTAKPKTSVRSKTSARTKPSQPATADIAVPPTSEPDPALAVTSPE